MKRFFGDEKFAVFFNSPKRRSDVYYVFTALRQALHLDVHKNLVEKFI